jgi:hypothetical protein
MVKRSPSVSPQVLHTQDLIGEITRMSLVVLATMLELIAPLTGSAKPFISQF